MREPADLPRIPKERIEPPLRKLSELKPGEQAILYAVMDFLVDEEGHLWVDLSSYLSRLPLIAGLSLQTERTEEGFIVWLDKRTTFKSRKRRELGQYLPVVEIREAPEA